MPDDGREPLVDEQTWSDLDMDAVCARIDRTVFSIPGRMALRRMLRSAVPSLEALSERDARIGALSPHRDVTRALRHQLTRLEGVAVVAATHDLELTELLRERYETCFFADDFSRDDMRFDYRLRPGVVTTRNAIRLLERLGYPQAILSHARGEQQ